MDVVEELRGVLSGPGQDGGGAAGVAVHELGEVVDLRRQSIRMHAPNLSNKDLRGGEQYPLPNPVIIYVCMHTCMHAGMHVSIYLCI